MDRSEERKDMVIEQFLKLIKVKSILTFVMTACMACLLLGKFTPSTEVLSLFCTSYGAIITALFAKGKSEADSTHQNTKYERENFITEAYEEDYFEKSKQ